MTDKASKSSKVMDDLEKRARACQICKDLPLGPRPLFQVSQSARVLIVGQAPGKRTHEKGIVFDDPSGKRLRDWMGLTPEQFYDASFLSILPMGFCYPGTGSSGDLPPRTECAPAWRQPLLDAMGKVDLMLIIGRYARDWHLPDRVGENLTDTIADWKSLLPGAIALPHPSPRNNRWLKQNPWFGEEVLPLLKSLVKERL